MDHALTAKLGKWPYAHDDRVLRLGKYLTTIGTAVPPAPDRLDLTVYVEQPFPMDGNDKYGDCTCAAAAHQTQVWSGMIHNEVVPDTPDVEKMYFAITGGPDVGADENSVLKYWSKNPLAGWSPAAYLACDPNNPEHIRQAANLFGGVYIGVQLPISANEQLQRSETWDLTSGPGSRPGSWGGHAVNVVGYDQEFVTVVTWGKLQKMTWRFWAAYCDEAWGVLPNGWEKAPGIDWALLETDLRLVAA